MKAETVRGIIDKLEELSKEFHNNYEIKCIFWEFEKKKWYPADEVDKQFELLKIELNQRNVDFVESINDLIKNVQRGELK